jgi:hypothetical protein
MRTQSNLSMNCVVGSVAEVTHRTPSVRRIPMEGIGKAYVEGNVQIPTMKKGERAIQIHKPGSDHPNMPGHDGDSA